MDRILIIGGGFAGVSAAVVAAAEARGHAIDVTLVSDSDHLVIRPRLYEPAPETLRVPLAEILDSVGVKRRGGAIQAIDANARTAIADDGDVLTFDRLILATGSRLAMPPVPGAIEHAFSIDTYDDAVAFDEHLAAVSAGAPSPGSLVFVVVGAGLAGIELATELRPRIAAHAGAGAADKATIYLVDRAPQLAADFGADARAVIEASLRQTRVTLRLGRSVQTVERNAVTLSDSTRIETSTVVMTSGLRASALTAELPGPRDALGRLEVDDTLALADAPHVYAAGDTACAAVDNRGRPSVMSCQHARTMGKYAGLNACRDILGRPPRPYRQPDYVTCLDLGPAGAVFTTGWERRLDCAGADAKRLKRTINTEWIYPPTGDAQTVFDGLAIDARGR